MTDKTLDGYCCKKDAQGNPHTFYIEQFTIPVLLEDCAQGEGVKYYLADVIDSYVFGVRKFLTFLTQQNARDTKRIAELERHNADLQAAVNKMALIERK